MPNTHTLPGNGLNPVMTAHLTSWTGRVALAEDCITAAPQTALSATLDRNDTTPVGASGCPLVPGTDLPPLWHWLFFLPRHRQSEIGVDGHAERGDFLPPVPLPRRMWAGGRLQWHLDNPLRVGQTVERRSQIASVSHKAGRSGALVFVRVAHKVCNVHGVTMTEEQDIVYRAAAGEVLPPDPLMAETAAAWQREVVPDAVLLFRYSALTFNGHRIHYDRRYATEVEGYPGLIVHGPLIATLLCDLVRRNAPEARMLAFEFRAVRPTFDLHPFRLNGQPCEDGKTVRLWAQDHEGFLTMQATATLD